MEASKIQIDKNLPEAIKKIPPKERGGLFAGFEKVLTNRARPLVDKDLRAVIIKTKVDADLAGQLILEIAEVRKAIGLEFDSNIRAAYALHKDLVAQKKRYDDPLMRLEGQLRSPVARYFAEEKRKAEEQERLLNAQVKKEADDSLLQVAEDLAAKGDVETAEALLDGAAVAEPPPVVVEPPSISGLSFPSTWKAKVVDLKKFLHGIIDGKIPAVLQADGTVTGVIEIHQSFLNTQAKQFMKELPNLYPGVEVEEVFGTRRTGR